MLYLLSVQQIVRLDSQPVSGYNMVGLANPNVSNERNPHGLARPCGGCFFLGSMSNNPLWFECPTCGMQRPGFGYCYDCTQPLKPIKNRPLAPEERAALTCGRISGRSSLAQQELLRNLGVRTEVSMRWTKYRASREITKRIEKARSGKPAGGQAGTAPARVKQATLNNPRRSGRPGETSHAVAGHHDRALSATPCSELHGGRDSVPQVSP